MMMNCYLNIAACSIKSKDWPNALDSCNEAIKLEPNNATALYRRARSKALPINAGVEDFKNALEDLIKAKEIEPENAVIRKEIQRL